MSNSWLTLILLALAAGIVPMLFAFETYVLSQDAGLKRGIAFFSGVFLFRLVLIVGLGILFTGFLTAVSSLFSNISTETQNLLNQIGQDIDSGQHFLFDGLLILSGIALWVQAYRRWTNRSEADRSAHNGAPTKNQGRGAKGMLLFGFSWMAISVNQWIFMTAAIGQILALSTDPLGRTLLAVLFLLITSLMLILPILFYIVRPQSAQRDLEKIAGWMHEALPYMSVIILVAIGLYFVVMGTAGLLNHLGSQ